MRIVHFDKNKGVAACLNHAIRISNGEFISWLSHDDIYDKNKILKQVELAKAKSIEDEQEEVGEGEEILKKYGGDK